MNCINQVVCIKMCASHLFQPIFEEPSLWNIYKITKSVAQSYEKKNRHPITLSLTQPTNQSTNSINVMKSMDVPDHVGFPPTGAGELCDQRDVGSWHDLRDQQPVPCQCVICGPWRVSFLWRRPFQVTSILTQLEEPVHVYWQSRRTRLFRG